MPSAWVFLGIDPGQSGAIVALRSSGEFAGWWTLKQTPRDLYDCLAYLGKTFPVQLVTVEKLWALPNRMTTAHRGSQGTWKLGVSYGMIQGFLVACKLRAEFVAPLTWQTYFGCVTKGDKNVSKQKAEDLWPNVKFTKRYADATLLAEYGRRHFLSRHLPLPRLFEGN